MKLISEFYETLTAQLNSENRMVLAIDGYCTAGKTTLAAELAKRYDAAVIHADHFFLREEQRTEERLAEPGGNFDRERFAAEILPHLRSGEPFSYRPYRCHGKSFGKEIVVPAKRLIIVEGTYSQHPELGRYYDLAAVLFVPSLVQVQRVLKRPKRSWKKYIHQWIPMEERYFETHSVFDRADFVLDGTELWQETAEE